MTATINGLPLLDSTFVEPLVGAWTAEVDVDTETAISGPVVVDIDGQTFAGVVRPGRGALEHGRYRAELVGGVGGLSTEIGAVFYDSASLRTVLADIMTATGEVLSPDTDADVLTHRSAAWSRPKGRAGLALGQVVDESPATAWRVQRDGTLWIGADTFPAVTGEYDEIDRHPGQGLVVIAPDAPFVRPGTTFDGNRVAGVTTTIRDRAVRQHVMWADDDGGDRIAGPFRRAVEMAVGKRIDYSQMYPCKVVQQRGDGTLDVLPDDERIRGAGGFSRVPIVHGLPGITVTVPAGGRVNLLFENGDPKAPRCALWADGSSVSTIKIAAGTQAVMRGDAFLTALNVLLAALSTWATASATPGKDAMVAAVTTFQAAPLQATFTSSVLKGE